MENTNTFKVQSTSSNLISLNVTPGHYATSSSHINYYIDMTSLKSSRSTCRCQSAGCPLRCYNDH